MYIAYTGKFTLVLNGNKLIGGTDITLNKSAKIISVKDMNDIWKNTVRH